MIGALVVLTEGPAMFRKLHDRVEPPGFETKLLRAMPFAAVASLVLPLFVAFAARSYANIAHVENAAKLIKSWDIFAWSVGATLLTAVLTITIGAVVVWIMKGPAYVADAYPVSHAQRPAPRHSRSEKDRLDNGSGSPD